MGATYLLNMSTNPIRVFSCVILQQTLDLVNL